MDSHSPTTDARPGICSRMFCELKKLAVLAVVVAALLVAGKYYGFSRLDEEVRARIEDRLAQHYRGMTVKVGSARRIAGRGVEICDITISAEGEPLPLVEIDEIIVECDTRIPDFLTKPPQITAVFVQRPKLRAVRRTGGAWNLAALWPLPSLGGSPPPATISDASIEIVDPTQAQAVPLVLRNIELTTSDTSPTRERGFTEDPSLARRASETAPGLMRIQGRLAGDHFEKVELDGTLDPRTAQFDLRGIVEGLEFSPRLKAALPRELSDHLQPLSTIRGRSQFGFQLARGPVVEGKAPPLLYAVAGKISEGRIDDARLPEPLSDVEATIRLENGSLVIEDLSARCGPTTIQLDAQLAGLAPGSPLKVSLQAQQVQLERWPLDALPEAVRRTQAQFSPKGLIDLAANLQFDGRTWVPEITAQCRDVSLLYDRYPLRLAGGVGTVELKQDRLQIRLRMLAGSQSVQIRSDIDHPGPNYTGWVELQSEGPLPIDEKLLAALDLKAQRIVRAFHPRGSVSLLARLHRGPQDPVPHRKVHITLHDCSIQHDKFFYPIDKVNGTLQQTDGDWLFRNLTGRNDSAYIVGEGSWLSQPADGNQLSLQFTATDVPLADELRQALSPGAQRLWANLRPRGNIDHLTVGMKFALETKKFGVDVKGEKWPPGQNVEGRSLSIEPACFRYRFDNLTGAIHYQDGTIQLSNLQAVHGRATFQTAGVCQVLADGGCRVQLSRLAADHVEMDHELLAALPSGLGNGLSRWPIGGPLNVGGALGITVPGQPEACPELDWDLTFDIDNGRIPTNIAIENIYGGLRLVGGSNARGVLARGELLVDSAMIRGIQLTQVAGPILLDSQRVVFGSLAEHDLVGRVPRQITMNTLDGTLSVDGEVGFGGEGPFQIQATLDQGNLATIARELAPRQRGLSGKVFGLVKLGGALEGSHTWRGTGQVRLRDADIYELPAMIALLNLVSLQRPDGAAFNTSDIDFRIVGDDLEFDRINFNGDSLCLKGTGRMNAVREVDLKFYPQMGRDEYQIPFFRPLLGEVNRQFMLIAVAGPLDKPQVTRQVFPELDARLQELFPELARDKEPEPVPVLSRPREALERAGLLPKRE